MKALDRKLLRELWFLKGQMLSIALVVASGIITVVTMRGSYESLIDAQQSYYRETRFADVWAPLKRASESVRRQLESIDGVAGVDTRVTFLATLDLPGLDAPASGTLRLTSRTWPTATQRYLRAARSLPRRPGRPTR